MATHNHGEQRIDIHEGIPPIPTNQTSSSSSNEGLSDSGLTFILILFVLSVIQIVASLGGLCASIVYEHPDHKQIIWVVGYASGWAVIAIFPLLYFRCRITSTLNLRQREVMTGFWITVSFFFLVWYALGVALFGGGSSSHAAPRLETPLVVLLFVGCLLSALPAIASTAVFCAFLPCLICVILDSVKEKSGGASTPDALGALPACKVKSKENGGRSSDESVDLAAGTNEERTLSGENVVCCICLRKFADNDEVREVPCCSQLFHVRCLDKWLKIKARCPLCQSQLGVGAEAITDATHSSHNRI